MRRTIMLVGLIVAPLLGSCGQSQVQATGTPFFSTHTYRFSALGGYTGQLVMSDKCLWIQSSGGRVLPIWPAALHVRVTATGVEIEDQQGKVVAVTGERLRVAARDATATEIREFIDAAAPSPCRGAATIVIGLIEPAPN